MWCNPVAYNTVTVEVGVQIPHGLQNLWTCGVVGIARVTEDHEVAGSNPAGDHEALVQIGSGPLCELAEILEAPGLDREGGNKARVNNS